jgi:hypothetical protein
VAASEIYEQVSSLEPKGKALIYIWGVKFMWLLLIAIVAATGLILLAWLWTQPGMQDVTTLLGSPDPNSATDAADRIELLERLRRNHCETYRDLFQLLVIGGLVPLFTLIAGYVFGRRQAERSQQEMNQDDST